MGKKNKSNKSEKSDKKQKKSKSSSSNNVEQVENVVEQVDEHVEITDAVDEVEVSDSNVTSQDETVSMDTPEKEIASFQILATDFAEDYKTFLTLAKKLNQDFKILVKTHNREIRTSRKFRRTRNTDKNKDPSGFNKPTLVPAKVAKLFNLEEDTMLARTVVTKMIYDYIKENKLQKEEDKRQINPDENLIDLFELKPEDELSFKSFQTHMKKLYPLKTQIASESTTV